MAHLVDSDTQNNETLSRAVLIVEGPERPSQRLREATRTAGFRVLTADSGHVALSAVKKAMPDAVILSSDIGPPGPSEIARRIKEDEATAEIPILLIGTNANADPFLFPTEAYLSCATSDEELVRTLRMLTMRTPRVRYGGERQAAPLQGDLQTDDFPQVLQFLLATGKTGRITVSDNQRGQGHIFLATGDIVDAKLGPVQGVKAFHEICFLTNGTFRFERLTPTRRTMCKNGLELLLESARRRDVAEPSHEVPVKTASTAAPPAPRSIPAKLALAAVALALVGIATYATSVTHHDAKVSAAVTVSVSSDPAGAQVSVDGREAGTTPIESITVSPGKLVFRLAREGCETMVESVNIAPDDTGRSLLFSLPSPCHR
ncbi:MAG TPA: DUF4388 domain-containing protein [Vicinamibacteria bacterium]|nr:DUF4388 domain-containing protein [Vicinamibacteria bacterium]